MDCFPDWCLYRGSTVGLPGRPPLPADLALGALELHFFQKHPAMLGAGIQPLEQLGFLGWSKMGAPVHPRAATYGNDRFYLWS